MLAPNLVRQAIYVAKDAFDRRNVSFVQAGVVKHLLQRMLALDPAFIVWDTHT